MCLFYKERRGTIAQFPSKGGGRDPGALGATEDEEGTCEMGWGAVTSVRHGEDGILGDAHTQGHLPEFLQQAFPKLWLTP